MEMHRDSKNVLLISMPFSDNSIPSIQLSLLESYLKKNNIDVYSLHLYLKAADFYSLKNYNLLINSPNDPYVAQLIFSKYVFLDHWVKNKNNFEKFYNKTLKRDTELFNFETFIESTDKFFNFICENIDWNQFDIIGFSLNYGQILPSLALSKFIKKINPEIKIVLGGSSVINELGINYLKAFDWIDFAVSGEGENALLDLAKGKKDYSEIPNLIYRDEQKIFKNQNENYIDLNALPYPDFTSFYKNLMNSTDENKQYFYLNGRLPIEFSRGCFWNKCSFCNISSYNKKYREKSIDRFVEELDYLSEKYKMLNFQVIANTLPLNDYRKLCKEIIKLGKDFNLYIEARAGRLKNKDYTLLKEAGFNHIQTGIETFSKNYLKKIKKGVGVIDNIAALKFSKENGIKNHYNLILNYPNEEKIDFEETKENINLFKQFLDPPQISNFIIVYDSEIYKSKDNYNISNIKNTSTDNILFPKYILKHDFSFYYNFDKKEERSKNNWEELISDWIKERKERMVKYIKNQKLIEKMVFYYKDGGSFLKIYDKRFGENVNIYILDDLERNIFLSCTDVKSLSELKGIYPNISERKILEILDSFEKNKLVFREEDRYLSLPLSLNKIKKFSKNITDSEKLVNAI